MEQEQKQTENTIDLTQLLQICRRHIWALIIWSVGLALVGWGVANFIISPKYTSNAQILVNQRLTRMTRMRHIILNKPTCKWLLPIRIL